MNCAIRNCITFVIFCPLLPEPYLDYVRQSLIIIFLLTSSLVTAQEDTVRHLKEVEVKDIAPLNPAESVMPSQILRHNNIQSIGGNSIADAARYFSGVQIKDYGGIGGLKTISVRSLGANHTGVSYDGVFLNDAQNGQIDLGKFSLDNVEQITLYNAQPANILQPARAFSYASVLDVKTAKPAFDDKKTLKLKASFNTGSFGLVNPSVTVQNKLSSKLTSSLNADWKKANGEYNFTYLNGSVTEKGRRSNADINAFHAAYNLRYEVNDSNVVNVGAYYYHSQRGLPGAIIFYTTQGTQRQWDENFFAQASWKKKFSRKSELSVDGKFNHSYYNYLDTSYPVTSPLRQNIFRQDEFYISGAYSYQIVSFAKIAYASDFFTDKLRSDQTNFATPSRHTFLNNISAQILFSRLQIDGNILSTTVNNKVEYGAKPGNYQHFSPTISFIYKPVENIPLRIRAFYKDIFRMPTFNDLYYTQVGNTNLKPEYTKQYNAGISWQQNFTSSFIQNILFTGDGYYNHIDDLILALPRQNISQWSMQNVGKVFIKGIDLSAKFNFKEIRNWKYSLAVNYTLQQALNNDKTSLEYNNEIPYTPKQFASFNAYIDYHSFSFAYNALFSGSRYNLAYNSGGLVLPKWNEQNILLSYNWNNKKQSWKLIFELNNLFNRQYQIVAYYPMPGRNFKTGIYMSI